ncbi:MAG: MG2 domain-containing protein, partial [Bacteroidota bacterium]
EFSDALAKDQDLTGLISMGNKSLNFSIEENRIKVYPKSKIAGTSNIQLSPGIKSSEGEIADKTLTTKVSFSEVKPELRLIGKGVILPKSESLPFIFEAIGLKAIDVRVIKIKEDNIPQFLQVSNLDQSRELKRVGEKVVEKSIRLDKNQELDLNIWNRHSLDLSELIDTDPGAIYEVALGFRKSYTLYTCEDEGADAEKNMLALDQSWISGNRGGYYYDYDDYDYYYDYQERDNPCNISYYTNRRIIKRNVLASDLGMIAKKGSDGSLYVVTDLKTTAPLAGVKLEIYNFQQRLIHTATTDAKGMVEVKHSEYPYLLIAKQGRQRGYLRMDDGQALSMSRFDTEGQKYYEGVKGFIYGERGVWRPGDPIFLNFILEDKAASIPEDHPVNFELYDSRGTRIKKISKKQGLNGFYTFHTETSADAPTGNYLAKVAVGGARFQKTVKVETIMPNRLKIALDFDKAYLEGKSGQYGNLSARWLHGAIAKNLKSDVRVSLSETKTSFEKYPKFSFDDPLRKLQSEEVTLFDGPLNAEGKARVPVKVQENLKAPGMLQAKFKIKVFEPGGAFSVDRFSVPYSPYSQYVGLRTPPGRGWRGALVTDKDHNVEIVTVNAEGRTVSSSVKLTLYKLKWRWWFERSRENLLNYRGKVNAEVVKTANLSTINGKANWNLKIDKEDWGRYLIRIEDGKGHITGQILYVDWPSWAGRSRPGDEGGAQMLNFTADREKYAVGEQVSLSIPSGEAGRALVSIENGTKVVAAYWIDAVKGTTKFSFPTTAEMAPNAYANVTLIQPHAQTANDLPIRMYGVIPIKVENPATHLSPLISMPNSLEPNSTFAVKVSEQNQKPMTYTLAVVDEGLLDLTRFETPDPWKNFYKRVALDVKTWDVYDHVLGAYGGAIKSLLSIGGGAGEEVDGAKKQDRFRPVVKFLGPFELKAGESKSHQIEMPNYIGSVRTMVVAADPDKGAYGSAEKATPVKKDLMVLGTLPRVLGPGENLALPVTVFAMDDKIKNVNIKVETGRRVLVNGKESQDLSFSTQGEQMAFFELGVLGSLGMDHIKITARSGSELAVYETDIEVRNPNQRVTDVLSQFMDKGQNWKQEFSPVGMRGTNNGYLEVSAIPPLDLGRRLNYLMRYPYGCIEQTTSSVFPQLYLARLMELNEDQKTEIDKNIRAGLERLTRFQGSGGGMSYWPGGYYYSDWGTNYAGNFIIEAKEAGYTLPSGMLEGWTSYQKDQARSWSGTAEWQQMVQSYRLFLLAYMGKAEIGAMNRLRKMKGLAQRAHWHLAGAYYLAGQRDLARKMVRGLSMDIQEYRQLGYTYGSRIRDHGIMLQVLSIMDEREYAKPLLTKISDALSNKSRWMSTQTTAFSLIGIAEYIGKKNKDFGKLAFSYRVNGGNWTKVDYSAPVWQYQLAEVKKGVVEFKNENKGSLYARLILDGIPKIGEEKEASNKLSIKLLYKDLNGKEINPSRLEQGSDFVAEVQVYNPSGRNYQELALRQIFPSGWEIHNSRMDATEGQNGNRPDYLDIRDDRVYTFFDIKSKDTKTFRVNLNASYLGKYYLPGPNCEAMYDKTINARSKGQWIEIVDPGSGG